MSIDFTKFFTKLNLLNWICFDLTKKIFKLTMSCWTLNDFTEFFTKLNLSNMICFDFTKKIFKVFSQDSYFRNSKIFIFEGNCFKSFVISSFRAFEWHDIEKSCLASLWSHQGWKNFKENEGFSQDSNFQKSKIFVFEGNGFKSSVISSFRASEWHSHQGRKNFKENEGFSQYSNWWLSLMFSRKLWFQMDINTLTTSKLIYKVDFFTKIIDITWIHGSKWINFFGKSFFTRITLIQDWYLQSKYLISRKKSFILENFIVLLLEQCQELIFFTEITLISRKN